MIYTLISLIIFTLYVVFIMLKYGVLKSISDSYYHLKHKAIFTIALNGFAIPAIISGSTVLMFLAGSGICFVAAAPEFRVKQEGLIHYIAAVLGIVLGMASMWIDFGLWWIPCIMAVGFLILRFTVKNYTWWIEVLAFYLIILGLLWKK